MAARSFGLRPKGKGEEERNYQQIKDTVMKELERYFRPEFIGRLDDVIVFRPLAGRTWSRSSSWN